MLGRGGSRHLRHSAPAADERRIVFAPPNHDILGEKAPDAHGSRDAIEVALGASHCRRGRERIELMTNLSPVAEVIPCSEERRRSDDGDSPDSETRHVHWDFSLEMAAASVSRS